MSKCAPDCACGRHRVTEEKRARARQLGYANRGKIRSPEHKAKMILNLKPGQPCPSGCDCPKHSDEARARAKALAESKIGIKRPSEHTPGRKCEPGCTCARHIFKPCPEGCTCGRHDEENRRLISEMQTGRKASAETRLKMTRSHVARWASMSDERRSEIIKKVSDGRDRGNGPSGLELAVRDVLDHLKIVWEPDRKISGFFPDLLLPDLNLLVEVNGCYWHACIECFPNHPDAARMHKRDRMKIGAYRKAGYACVVLVEHDFTIDPEGAVMHALQGGGYGS